MRDALPDVPRPILSRDEPPFVPVEERPVPRNMQISQDIPQSQDCRTRIEAASRINPVSRYRAERAEQRKMDFYAREVERIDNPRRASLEPCAVPGPPTEEKRVGMPSGPVGEPEQDLSGEITVPSAHETLTTPEIPVLPYGALPSSSLQFRSLWEPHQAVE